MSRWWPEGFRLQRLSLRKTTGIVWLVEIISGSPISCCSLTVSLKYSCFPGVYHTSALSTSTNTLINLVDRCARVNNLIDDAIL